MYTEFGHRLDEYSADGRNVVLCRAGCSHCCREGGFFAMTVLEALRLRRAVAVLPPGMREAVETRATTLLSRQHATFASDDAGEDVPGARDEVTFSARVSRVTREHPVCPLLEDDRCSVYAARPFLCRAYGYPVDAYAVESAAAKVFRSLCVLYEGVQLRNYVRAKALRARIEEASRGLTGGVDVGRFTLPEAILAREAHGVGGA